jgi:hypothetical protein
MGRTGEVHEKDDGDKHWIIALFGEGAVHFLILATSGVDSWCSGEFGSSSYIDCSRDEIELGVIAWNQVSIFG